MGESSAAQGLFSCYVLQYQIYDKNKFQTVFSLMTHLLLYKIMLGPVQSCAATHYLTSEIILKKNDQNCLVVLRPVKKQGSL